MRPIRRVVAAALVGALAFAGMAADPADPGCAFAEPSERDWGSVRPSPPRRDDRLVATGGDSYVAFAVGQDQGLQAAVVDTRSLQVTGDAGCTWTEAFAFGEDADPEAGIEPSTARFVGVAVSDRPAGDERVVALVYDLEVFGATRVATVVSTDGGQTFRVAGEGLPDALALPRAFEGCGDELGCLVQIAPSDPDIVYVMVAGLDGAELYVSRDGGLTFQRQNGDLIPFLGEARDAYPTTLAVDPSSARTLWGGEERGTLMSSTTFGDTWQEHDLSDAIGRPIDGVSNVAVADTGEDLEVLAVVDVDGESWTVHSPDEGRTWTAFETGLRNPTLDVAGASEPGAFLLTDRNGAYRLDLAGEDWQRIGGSSLGPLSDIHPLTDSSTVWFRGPQSLPVIGDLQFVPPPVQIGGGFEVEAFDPLDPVGTLPGDFTWPNELIELEVGQSQLVPFLLTMPQTQTKLDVFFVFDQSGSMSDEIDALARGMQEITNELIRRRVDVWVGLGGYSGGYRYIMHRDIGPPNAEFKRALERMGTGGGAVEPVYTALHQIATGSGLDEDTRAGLAVPEGENANWRGGAVRVVVNLTDEQFQVEQEGPTAQEAIDAVVERRIKVVSLISTEGNVHVSGDVEQNDPTSVDGAVTEDDFAFGEAATLAKVTEALAGPSGVDCGGDGEIDIPAGGPIACYLGPLIGAANQTQVDHELLPNLADVVVEILDGVTEVHTVEFHTELPDVVTDLEPLDPVTVDIRDPQQIRVRATVTCGAHRAGQVLKPLITAVASSAFLAAGRLVVKCGDLPVEDGEVPLAAAPPPPVAVAAAPPAPAPPAPVTATATSTAGATSPAASTATMPQVGMAAAVQHEQQVRTASLGPESPSRPETESEFAFSAVREDSSSAAPVTLLLGAAMTVGAGAFARRRQQASVPGRVHVRR